LEFTDYLRNTQPSSLFDFGYLKPIIRRRWLAANGIKYQEKLRLGEDLMLIFDCYAHRAKVILVSKAYYHYNLQYSQVSQQMSPTTRTQIIYEPLSAAADRFIESRRSILTRVENLLLSSACEGLREIVIVAVLKERLRQFDVVGVFSCLRHPVRLSKGLYFEKLRSVLFRRRAKRFARSNGS
jgi:hypothetical protein